MSEACEPWAAALPGATSPAARAGKAAHIQPDRHRGSLAVPDSRPMIRLTPQQSSDLLGAVQEAASQAAGFSHALAVAGQTDAALHFEYQRARLAELERLLTADGKRPVAVELM